MLKYTRHAHLSIRLRDEVKNKLPNLTILFPLLCVKSFLYNPLYRKEFVLIKENIIANLGSLFFTSSLNLFSDNLRILLKVLYLRFNRLNIKYMELKSLAVYCGSMKGTNPAFAQKATELGLLMAEKNIKLVYGGGKVGLMGVIAETVVRNGGQAVGVAPHFLMKREVVNHDLHELHAVDTMYERRNMMIDLSDGFIAMPGGYGTLDEIGEVLMLTILGKKKFPVGFLNVDGFYDPMIAMLDSMVHNGFLQKAYRDNALFSDNPTELLQMMHDYVPPTYDKFTTGDIHK
jgi:uncharacterized protein (TIGR00730 family)